MCPYAMSIFHNKTDYFVSPVSPPSWQELSGRDLYRNPSSVIVFWYSRIITAGAVLTCVVDLSGARVDSLEQLVHLLIRHLLAQIRQDVLELADADEARHVLVEDLETAAVLLGLAWVAEAAGAVQHALEGLKVDWNV